MFIKVSTNGGLTLEDGNNFRAFKVVVEGRPRDALDDIRGALTGVAELPDADTAWVLEDALRAWPEVVQDSTWQRSLTGMIEKAKPHGWIDEARKAIKAHVEWA